MPVEEENAQPADVIRAAETLLYASGRNITFLVLSLASSRHLRPLVTTIGNPRELKISLPQSIWVRRVATSDDV